MRFTPKRIRRKWKKIYPQFKHKHKLIVMDAETYVEKFSLTLTGRNLFTITGLSIIGLIILTTILIAFTPLREYIPGYSSTEQELLTYQNKVKLDSLENYIRAQEIMIDNIRLVISGEDIPGVDDFLRSEDTSLNYENIELKTSKQDSLFRLIVEKETKESTIDYTGIDNKIVYDYGFVIPVVGKPMKTSKEHIGIDIEAKQNQEVRAIDDGVVLMCYNTTENKKIILIQHSRSFVSAYKNLEGLLKLRGEEVRKGEVIGLAGGSGSCQASPYLHFELWYDSQSVNPLDYIKF